MKRIVATCGGRGFAAFIPALIAAPHIDLTLIVNAYDDGKSTGEIRRFFSMLGPSDIRKCQTAMLPASTSEHHVLRQFMEYRLPVGQKYLEAVELLSTLEQRTAANHPVEALFLHLAEDVKGLVIECLRSFLDNLERIRARGLEFNFSDCSIANCLYAGMYFLCDNDFELAVERFRLLLGIRGNVIVSSVENGWLVGLRENGDFLPSEASIVELRANSRLLNIFLLDSPADQRLIATIQRMMETDTQRKYLACLHRPATLTERCKEALAQADVIIFAAGTQHSSLLPTYMAQGFASAIARNRSARKILITNIGEDYEIPAFTADDIFTLAERYMWKSQESAIQRPPTELITDAIINVPTKPFGRDFKYVRPEVRKMVESGIHVVLDNFENPDDLGKHHAHRVLKCISEICGFELLT